ncbi:zinc finger, CCHC-type containing protein [Tanacetum coccineum]
MFRLLLALKLWIFFNCLASLDGGTIHLDKGNFKEIWNRRFLEEVCPPSLSGHFQLEYMRKTSSMDTSCDTSGMLNKLTISKTRSTCSWASSFLFPKKAKVRKLLGASVNMTKEGRKNKNNKQNKGKKHGFNENNDSSGLTRNKNWNVGSVARLATSRRIAVVVTRKTQMLVVWERGLRTNPKTKVDAIAWWIDSGATTYVCKDRYWFKTYEPVEDESNLYMMIILPLFMEKENLISGPVLNKCGYKQVYESDKYILSKSGVFVGFGYYNNGMFMLNLNKVPNDSGSVYMSSFTVVNSSLWHARLGHVHYKRMFEMSKDDLIPVIDENPKNVTTCILTKITRQPFKSITRKSIILDLIHSDFCDCHATPSLGIINETTSPYTPQQNGVAERKNRALKKMVKSMLSYLGLSEGSVVRLPDPKRKTLGEKGIDGIFVGYAEHSKAYRFYVIKPNDSIFINSIIESRDAIFDDNRFSSVPRPKDIIPNSDESQRDDHSNDVPSETPKPHRAKRARKAKSYGSDFQLYLKEAIDDEIGFIMENNTWVISDLPPGCKPLGSKWIFKRKMKVDGTIDKFKARLVIQGFRQKEGINYFDTYAPIARITTIRLLLALASIHNLVIHRMDVKTTFLNGDLEEEVYKKQLEGFVMPGNEYKLCKLVKSLYGLKQAPNKFDDSDKGVMICLYVDDMRIFGTDQNQVDKTKKFLSSRFSMKDMGEADVILGIKIKRENKGIVITQSHYIEKILKKFNHKDCSPVSTPMDLVEKLMPNTGKPVDQLEYSRAIGYLMYAMTSTRPDIA